MHGTPQREMGLIRLNVNLNVYMRYGVAPTAWSGLRDLKALRAAAAVPHMSTSIVD